MPHGPSPEGSEWGPPPQDELFQKVAFAGRGLVNTDSVPDPRRGGARGADLPQCGVGAACGISWCGGSQGPVAPSSLHESGAQRPGLGGGLAGGLAMSFHAAAHVALVLEFPCLTNWWWACRGGGGAGGCGSHARVGITKFFTEACLLRSPGQERLFRRRSLRQSSVWGERPCGGHHSLAGALLCPS